MRLRTAINVLSAVILAVPAFAAERKPLVSAAELNGALWTNAAEAVRRPFALRGTLTARLFSSEFVFEDATGRFLLHLDPGQNPRVGDIIEITGHVSDRPDFRTEAWSKTLAVVGHTNATVFAERPLASLRGRDCQALPVTTSGFVEEAFRDEVDPGWFILILRDGTASIPVSVHDDGSCDDLATRLFSRRIRLSGVCLYNIKGERRYTGLRILVCDPKDIRIEPDGEDHGIAAPPVDFTPQAPADVVAQGRRSVRGTVLTAWRGTRVLLKTDDNTLLRADLVRGEKLPSVGASVEATGNAETDLLRINLSQARLRLLPRPSGDAQPTSAGTRTPPALSPADLFLQKPDGSRSLNGQAYGRIVCVCGQVASHPQPGVASATLDIRCGDTLLPVDVGNCPDMLADAPLGATVELSGVCVFETENWRPGNPFPRITGFVLVLNDARDFRLAQHPSWWTVRRLVSVLGLLLAVLAVAGVWVVLLRRTLARRGRELEAEVIARVGSDFKAHERTRLAVELHDAISQNLTGVALELQTAGRRAQEPAAMREHLVRAERTLAACREELKNCIWDLRNSALDEADLNEAVRRTLEPHLGDATLVTRLAVPRERLTEHTTHALLRILRELTTNAVRHGKARTVRVAGCVENGKLLISVRDDGCGFDPSTAPGFESGHFGLEGIRERVETFEGELTVESAPGAGTRATVTLNMPNEEPA